VVANQVGDRFTGSDNRRISHNLLQQTQSSPLAHRGNGPLLEQALHPQSSVPQSSISSIDLSRQKIPVNEAMTLDHQQRWFTGWGDDPLVVEQKTPSLGLIWTVQIACRIALIKSPIYSDEEVDGDNTRTERSLKGWRRRVKVVFAPWAGPTDIGTQGAVEFRITSAGLEAVVDESSPTKDDRV
jgi:DNA repair protein RAD57